MEKLTRWMLLVVMLVMAYISTYASDTVLYTDYNPSYRQFMTSYMIDQVGYTEDKIIIHFRFASQSPFGGRATFFGAGTSRGTRWYLEDPTGRKYDLQAVKDLRKNDQLLTEQMMHGQSLSYTHKTGDYFTCQVIFERPTTATQVDLIEGIGKRNNPNHFNCLALKLKPKGSPELGSASTADQRIHDFNTAHGVETDAMLPSDTPTIPPREAEEAAPAPVSTFDEPILFEKGEVDFAKNIDDKIKDWGKEMANRDDYQYIEIRGYTDFAGPYYPNFLLSHKRANKVKKLLIESGVEPDKLVIKPMGESEPITDNRDIESRKANRRVELKIIK